MKELASWQSTHHTKWVIWSARCRTSAPMLYTMICSSSEECILKTRIIRLRLISFGMKLNPAIFIIHARRKFTQEC